MAFKAIRKDGLWIITAVIHGRVEEFAGKRLRQAIQLYYRAQDRAAQGVMLA